MEDNFLKTEKIIQHEIHNEMKNSYIKLLHERYCRESIAGCKRWIKTCTQKNIIWNE